MPFARRQKNRKTRRSRKQCGGISTRQAEIARLEKEQANLEAELRNPQRIHRLFDSDLGFPEPQAFQVAHVRGLLHDVKMKLMRLRMNLQSNVNEDPEYVNENQQQLNEDPQPLSGGKRTRKYKKKYY